MYGCRSDWLLFQIEDYFEKEFHCYQELENLWSVWTHCALNKLTQGQMLREQFSGRIFYGCFVFKGSHIVIISVYFPLTGFTFAKRLLRHVLSFSVVAVLKDRAIDLHFPVLGGSQSLQERTLSTASGLAAFKRPDFSKWSLRGSFEILLTWKHKFRSKGPFCLKAPKYFLLFPCSWFLELVWI